MNRNLVIILLTCVGFSAGLGSGLWIGRSHVPCQPPPAWLYTEFADITRAGPPLRQLIQSHPALWREINAELATLKPRMDEFKGELWKIDADFRRDLEALLSPAQKEKLAQAQVKKDLPKIYADFGPPAPAQKTVTPQAKPTTPAAVATEPMPKIAQERSDGMVSSFAFIAYTQERFTQLLELDQEQAAKLGLLLQERRARFLKLCDDTPPPSLQLKQIATLIRNAAEKR